MHPTLKFLQVGATVAKRDVNIGKRYVQLGNPNHQLTLRNKFSNKTQSHEPFNFANYQTQLRDAKLKNNGHTVQLDSPNNFTAQISGGGLGGTYQFAQLHFHWGDSNNKGSEHTMDGQAFPLEVHLVHFNTK